jgi:hypothetical protein
MSLAKTVPDSLNPQECKRLRLCETPPVPYMSVKDEVQEEVSKMRNLQIKTSLKKGTTLNFPVWHDNGTKEAIKKRGYFKDYEKAQQAYVEHKQVVKSAKASLALLDRTSKGSGKSRKLKKAKETEAKAKEAEAKSKEAEGVIKVPKDPMKAAFQVDLEKAKKATEDAQDAMTAAASKMFAFYLNLLSPESKYLWNKIVVEQTKSDLIVNLQGVTHEGPRGMSCKLFNNWVMFHLLTVFPINMAEQEKYYITNVLKKPQPINVRQFVCQVEQLNTYIAQMLCFFYSPKANASTKPKNVLFTKAELGSHVLRMCPIQWQDQYNMNKKGMTLMDMRLLLTSLEAIKRLCTYKKAKPESSKKASHKSEKGKKHPGTKSMARVPKKVRFEKHCDLCKRHGGAYTMHNTRDCHRFKKNGKEKSKFCAAKKGGKKANTVNQNFAQLTKKIEELEIALKKSGKNGKKCRYKDSDSNSE